MHQYQSLNLASWTFLVSTRSASIKYTTELEQNLGFCAFILKVLQCLHKSRRKRNPEEILIRKRTILLVQRMDMRRYHTFCNSMHQHVPYGKTQHLYVIAHPQSLNAHQRKTHLNVPHGENN